MLTDLAPAIPGSPVADGHRMSWLRCQGLVWCEDRSKSAAFECGHSQLAVLFDGFLEIAVEDEGHAEEYTAS